jgi:hypothetical protein
MLLRCDGREQHQARRALAAVVGLARVLDELVQVGAEFRQPFGALERLVETEEGEDDVRLYLRQPLIGRAEVLRARARDHFIRRHGKVAEDQLVLGELVVGERFEVAGVLHPVRQRVADDGDVIAGAQLQLVSRTNRSSATSARANGHKSRFIMSEP